MSDMSRFADIVSSEVYECIGGYYNVSVDYTEGSLASLNLDPEYYGLGTDEED